MLAVMAVVIDIIPICEYRFRNSSQVEGNTVKPIRIPPPWWPNFARIIVVMEFREVFVSKLQVSFSPTAGSFVGMEFREGRILIGFSVRGIFLLFSYRVNISHICFPATRTSVGHRRWIKSSD